MSAVVCLCVCVSKVGVGFWVKRYKTPQKITKQDCITRTSRSIGFWGVGRADVELRLKTDATLARFYHSQSVCDESSACDHARISHFTMDLAVVVSFHEWSHQVLGDGPLL